MFSWLLWPSVLSQHGAQVFLGLAQNGYYEDAMRVFQRLRSMGICSTYAFNVMIGIQCRRRDMEAAMESMDTMNLLLKKSQPVCHGK